MDRERMIEVLKMDRDLALFDPTTGECRPMNELNAESAEALDMAIKSWKVMTQMSLPNGFPSARGCQKRKIAPWIAW